jgi:hypothetical protein
MNICYKNKNIVLFGVFVLVITTCVYLCDYHLLPILMECYSVGVLGRSGWLWIMCLTFMNYLVVSCGSVIPRVLYELMFLFLVL